MLRRSERRKPAPGMLLEALQLFGAAAADAVMVGDSVTDLQAAARAGVTRKVLVSTGHGAKVRRCKLTT